MSTPARPAWIYTPPNFIERYLPLDDATWRAHDLIRVIPQLRDALAYQEDPDHHRHYEHESAAVLVLESGGGVVASVEGVVAGRLRPEDADQYRPHLLRLHAAGYMLMADATISAAPPLLEEMSPTLSVNVRVAAPHHLIPTNRETTQGVAILPWHRKFKVAKVTDHYQALAPYTPPAGEALVVVTLHQVSGDGRRKDYIAVHLDGTPVGELSPTTSARLIPAIGYAEDKGLTLGAWGLLTGSDIAVELHIRVRVAAELPSHWLDSPTAVPEVPQLLPGDAQKVELPPPTPPAEEPTYKRALSAHRQAARPSPTSSPWPRESPQTDEPLSIRGQKPLRRANASQMRPQAEQSTPSRESRQDKAPDQADGCRGCCLLIVGAVAVVALLLMLLAM